MELEDSESYDTMRLHLITCININVVLVSRSITMRRRCCVFISNPVTY